MMLRTILAALSVVFTACTLLSPFDPEGQKCDAQNLCLEGYGCVDGRCQKGAPNVVDCAQCPSGACVPGTSECLPFTCQYKLCQAGYECVNVEGVGPSCRIISAGETTLGFTCFDEAGCQRPADGAPRHCLLGAIPAQNGSPRGGVCVEECGDGDTCTTPGAVCRSFPLGADAGVTRVCLPPNTLSPCTRNDACERGGLVCTVFDSPAVGPLTACDAPPGASARTGEACTRKAAESADGGSFCSNGLCVPDPSLGSGPPVCAALCDGADSCTASFCAQVEFAVQSTVRYVPMCIPRNSRCASCATDPQGCAADAPHCVPFNGESRCLGACTPDAGPAHQCPPDYACQSLAGAFYCTPSGGTCP